MQPINIMELDLRALIFDAIVEGECVKEQEQFRYQQRICRGLLDIELFDWFAFTTFSTLEYTSLSKLRWSGEVSPER